MANADLPSGGEALVNAACVPSTATVAATTYQLVLYTPRSAAALPANQVTTT